MKRKNLDLTDLEKNFLVGVLSGARGEPDDLLDGWEEMEREDDLEAMRAEKRDVIDFPGPDRKEGGPRE